MKNIKGHGLRFLAVLAAAATLVFGSPGASAQDAVIRKNLAARLAKMPAIDEINKTPIPGIYEIRVGNQVFYSDEHGDHVFQGSLIDTRSGADLTQARLDKINAIEFARLPLQDALVWKQGNGERKLVVFADPNCTYCKRFETDLQQVKNVTVYTFLFPILGGDSPDKARNIWCSKDNGQVWRNWMIHGTPAPRSMGPCDTSALQRNLALGKKFRVTGTPSVVFEDGKRVPGALAPDEVEKRFQEVRGG